MPTRLAAFTALVLILPAAAADQKTGFLTRTFTNDDGTTSEYVVFVPHDYDGTKAYPVILFLHGAGETKGGKKMPAEVGIGPAIKKNEKAVGFIVVIPQAESVKTRVGGRWYADAPDGKRALAMLDAVQKEYKTDPDRVILTGLSMGGFGTWQMAFAHPDKWAAIVPVCGGGDPKAAEKIKHLPCWCFHGDKDPAVKVELSRRMVEALKAAGGAPKYTEYPDVGHNSWDKAYGTPELWTWMAEQKRPKK
jgi:predicted peptidase